MSFLNVEIKASCTDHERIRALLEDRGARFDGLDHQIDTYFATTTGRLKLREGNVENALIHYQRDACEGPKKSRVTLYKATADPALKDVLSEGLGVLVVVDKKREIYFLDNVKFHLDNVAGLGRFVEIEAIDYEGSIGESRLHEQCQQFLGLFNISPQDLIACSYSDMMLNR